MIRSHPFLPKMFYPIIFSDEDSKVYDFNTFYATGLFLYPLKTSGNQRFIEKDQLHEMG